MKSSMSLLGKVLVHFVVQLTSFGTNFELRIMHSSNLLMLIFQLVEGSQVQGDWALVRTEQSPKFPSMSALRQVFVMYVNCFLFDFISHCVASLQEGRLAVPSTKYDAFLQQLCTISGKAR